LARFVSPDTRTRRSQVEIAYQQRALAVLRDEPGLEWIRDVAKMEAGAPNAWRRGILRALGRVDNPADMIALAHTICEQRPPAKHAARVIRQLRLGKQPAGASALELTGLLAEAVYRYRMKHPDLTTRQVRAACQNIMDGEPDE
jgi:hypothetical protein